LRVKLNLSKSSERPIKGPTGALDAGVARELGGGVGGQELFGSTNHVHSHRALTRAPSVKRISNAQGKEYGSFGCCDRTGLGNREPRVTGVPRLKAKWLAAHSLQNESIRPEDCSATVRG